MLTANSANQKADFDSDNVNDVFDIRTQLLCRLVPSGTTLVIQTKRKDLTRRKSVTCPIGPGHKPRPRVTRLYSGHYLDKGCRCEGALTLKVCSIFRKRKIFQKELRIYPTRCFKVVQFVKFFRNFKDPKDRQEIQRIKMFNK